MLTVRVRIIAGLAADGARQYRREGADMDVFASGAWSPIGHSRRGLHTTNAVVVRCSRTRCCILDLRTLSEPKGSGQSSSMTRND